MDVTYEENWESCVEQRGSVFDAGLSCKTETSFSM